MNEDLSAMVRTGVTIVLVAALTSTILTLMVVAQTILNSGSGTLANNVDAITLQKYQQFNGGTQSGTDVKATVGQYASEEIAILIHTKTMSTADEYYNFNYLLEGVSGPTAEQVNGVQCLISKVTMGADTVITGMPYRKKNLKIGSDGLAEYNGDTKILTAKGAECFILDSARFNSQLVKDSNDLIVGIMFTQRQ